MPNDQTPVATDNLELKDPSLQAQNQPVGQEPATQPEVQTKVEPQTPQGQPQPAGEPAVDWEKRYSDSSREAQKIANEKAEVEKLLSVIEEVYKDNKTAYEAFREGMKVKTGKDIPSYEDAYGNGQAPAPQPNATQPAQSSAPTKEDIDIAVARKLEQQKAYGTYWEAYPEMDPSKYTPGTPEYQEKGNLEAKVVVMANTLMTTLGIQGGDALKRAHQIVTNEDATTSVQREEQARLRGLSEGLSKGTQSSPSNSAGQSTPTTQIQVTEEDKRIAASSKRGLTPEKVADLRLKGLLT